jgi:hypothetical protein
LSPPRVYKFYLFRKVYHKIQELTEKTTFHILQLKIIYFSSGQIFFSFSKMLYLR